MTHNRPKIVVIGGGTGSFVILSNLKQLDCDITALVSMADDGGSTGQLRDEYGVLPPGDVRQCLVALSDAPLITRDLFNFRFPGNSTLGGHSFGNLFLSAVEIMTDNFSEAVKTASQFLNIKGQVLPVTTEKCQLIMETAGKKIKGESTIDLSSIKSGSKPEFYLKPKAKLNPSAKKAIAGADLIIIAPGNLYSSITPALIVKGMSEALTEAKAKVIYVCNLVNKPNHVFGFKVSDYVKELERFIGQGAIDYVLYNVDIPSDALLKKYAADKEFPVIVDEKTLKKGNYIAIAGNFLSSKTPKRDENDTLLKRTFLRHDGKAVAKAINSILQSTTK